MPKIKYPYQLDPRKRKIAKAYSRAKLVMDIANSIVVPLAALAVFVLGGYHLGLAAASAALGALQVPVFILGLYVLLTACRFPLHFYSSYIHEHKYKLSAYTLKGWFKDYLKASALALAISVLLFSLLYAFLMPLALWWLYAGVAFFFLTVLFSYIFPTIIFPIFYKTKPYSDGKMIGKLKRMAARYGVRVKKVLLAKESEKSVKANAFFAGLGSTKRIVLFDTLCSGFATAEIETVVAHELGHYVNRDVVRFIIIEAIKIFPVLFIVDYLLRATLAGASVAAIAGLPLLLLYYYIIELVLMPFVNTYSRRREAAADWFALEACGKPQAQASSERRLADTWLAELQPHWLEEIIFDTHPSAAKRIKMCEDFRKRL